jgi:maltose alpha-D-glucosyltransferase / alpha-amylase
MSRSAGFFTEQRRFTRTPNVAGTFQYARSGSEQPYTLGILQALVANQGDGWSHALEELGRYYERCLGRMAASEQPPVDSRPPLELARATPPLTALEAIGPYLYAARALGRRTAEMHLALAADCQGVDFAPEPLTADDMARIQAEIRHQADQSLVVLEANIDRLPAEIMPEAQRLLSAGPPAIDFLISAVSSAVPAAVKIRIHGDYHLGQVLWVDNDYVILDFEGEPTRTVAERRGKFSPVRDVAGMLRSYHYAAFAGLFAFTRDRPDDLARLAPWAEMWHQWTSAALLREYLAEAGDAPFLPKDFVEFSGLLDAFVLAKALYELAYELNNRPDWVRIPLSGVTRLLGLENHGEKE